MEPLKINKVPDKQTILVVDDEEEALRAISTLLERRGGYRTLSAKSGEEAKEILLEYDIDLVITDLRMPGMDGLELLKHINDNYPMVYVIISTAYASVDSAIDALRKGAVDYLQKPNQPREMLEKVESVLRKRQDALRERAEYAHIREIAASQASEMMRAGAMQQRWIPEGYEGRGIRIITRFHGATELSGDFIDIVELANDKIGIAVGDVVGHGLPASLQMGIVQRLIRRELLDGKQVAEIFTSINDFLYDEFHMDSAFTSFVAIFDGVNYTLEYAIGGHPPPMIVGLDGTVEYLETSCPGLLMVPKFKYMQHSLILKPGERFAVYTDGVVEARNEDGELFDETRLEATLRNSVDMSLIEVIDSVEDALNRFRGDAPLLDDTSLILVEIL